MSNPIDYSQLVRPDSFIGTYLRQMANQETAHAFDWWCALWCISAVCGRETYVARPRAPVYLNMFTVLVGDSGVARKTTSVMMATRLVRPVLRETGVIGMIDAKATPESLELLLHERSDEHGSAQLCITVPELAVFLGTERYVAHMPTLLTDLYDCPDMRHGAGTIQRGEVVHRNVWLNFLTASTPIWLLKTVNPNVIEGGFTSRCYFIVSNEPKATIPWPDADAEDYTSTLIEYLRAIRHIAERHGGITLTPDALVLFTHWYNNRQRDLDPYKQSFAAREDAHVLRIAAILCINDGFWRIQEEHIIRGIQLVQDIKDKSGSIFETSETMTKYATALDAVRSMLVSTGMDPIPRHKLYLKCRTHIDNDEFLSLIEVLHEIGAIQRFVSSPEGKGRPTEFIRGTNLLLSRGLGEQVLDRFV